MHDDSRAHRERLRGRGFAVVLEATVLVEVDDDLVLVVRSDGELRVGQLGDDALEVAATVRQRGS